MLHRTRRFSGLCARISPLCDTGTRLDLSLFSSPQKEFIVKYSQVAENTANRICVDLLKTNRASKLSF